MPPGCYLPAVYLGAGKVTVLSTPPTHVCSQPLGVLACSGASTRRECAVQCREDAIPGMSRNWCGMRREMKHRKRSFDWPARTTTVDGRPDHNAMGGTVAPPVDGPAGLAPATLEITKNQHPPT